MNNSIYKKGLAVVLIVALIIMTFLGVKLASKDNDIISSNFYENESNGSNKSDINDVELTDDNSVVNDDKQIIVVDIDGAVRNPGVYEFSEGERINDAINKAGGLLDYAYTKNLNKARKLIDGEKIYILKEGEETFKVEMIDDSIYNNTGESQNGNKININTASKELLMSLDGIGEVYAKRIIDYRDKMKFKTTEEIKNIEGIGAKTFDKIKDFITVK